MLYRDDKRELIPDHAAAELQEKRWFASRMELISPEVAVFIQAASSLCAIPRCSAAGSVLRGISRSLGKAVMAWAQRLYSHLLRVG